MDLWIQVLTAQRLQCKGPYQHHFRGFIHWSWPHYLIGSWKMMIFLIVCLPWNIVSSSKTKQTKKAPWLGLSFSLPILSTRDWCLVICISDHCFVGGFVYCFSFFFAFPVNLCFYILKVFQCIAVITFSDAWGQERGGILFFPFDWRKFQHFLVGRALECPSFREWRALGLAVQDQISVPSSWCSIWPIIAGIEWISLAVHLVRATFLSTERPLLQPCQG